MVSETLICEKECSENEKADELNVFDNCVNPSDPLHSSAKFCSNEYKESEEKWIE
jgi:hypothetical protein